MRVAWVLRRFGGPGGTEKYSADLARHLVSRGWELTVFCARAHPDGRASGARVVELPVDGRGWAADRAFWAASARVREPGQQLVQGFGLTAGHDVFRAGGGAHRAWLEASGRWSRIRAALSPRERWVARVDREAARSARAVVCNSEMAARDVVRWHGIPLDRVRVVRNGVDGERFSPSHERRERAREAWRVPDGGRVALFLGTGFRRKGLATAARAFERSAGPRDRLVVIGRDSRAQARLRSIEQHLGGRLVAHGPVDDPERWIPGADAVVLPTRYDAAANSTLEALSCGVPPVTSAMDGSAEVVPDPRLVVRDPADAEGFARALIDAWSGGPSLADSCRRAASEWTVARNGTTMETLYRELADG